MFYSNILDKLDSIWIVKEGCLVWHKLLYFGFIFSQ